jgi:NAD(P)-dependent dehydrogenase (short-subunit alcohol dehydrogenase family)
MDQDNVNCILQREFPEPREIAASVAFLLDDESAHVTKSTWSVDGGWFEAPLSRT